MMSQWYVIFVRSGFEEKITNRVNRTSEYVAFIPKKVVFERKQGVVGKKPVILFPGYVFIETEQSVIDVRIFLENEMKGVIGYIRLLGNNMDPDIQSITSEERRFIEQFTNHNKVIDSSVGYIVGDQVVITEGPLIGFESRIKRIDRHKRTVEMELLMFGQLQKVRVGCEIMSKATNKMDRLQ